MFIIQEVYFKYKKFNFELRNQPEKENVSVMKCIFTFLGCQNFGAYTSIPVWKSYSLLRGKKSHLEKQSHLRSQFPPEMTLLKSQQKLSFLPKIKFPVHSHLEYMLQKGFKMTGFKLIIGRLLMIGIYWLQANNRRFMHYHTLFFLS